MTAPVETPKPFRKALIPRTRSKTWRAAAAAAATTPWRNRIVGSAEVDPKDLVANPLNWRTHPDRQREALVLRFYLDLPDEEIARVMGIRQSTVRSTAHRGLEALGRDLRETS